MTNDPSEQGAAHWSPIGCTNSYVHEYFSQLGLKAMLRNDRTLRQQISSYVQVTDSGTPPPEHLLAVLEDLGYQHEANIWAYETLMAISRGEHEVLKTVDLDLGAVLDKTNNRTVGRVLSRVLTQLQQSAEAEVKDLVATVSGDAKGGLDSVCERVQLLRRLRHRAQVVEAALSIVVETMAGLRDV